MADTGQEKAQANRGVLAFAALQGFAAVAAGAFAAHGVSDPAIRDWLRTGAQYGLAHVLAALAVLAVLGAGARGAKLPAWLFLAGAAVFSGSLYLMALTGMRWLGAVTPIGGLSMLAGWACFAWASWRQSRRQN
jgi:uncharacterized membrane protein YgdD (TMEM256/DUF423 family)